MIRIAAFLAVVGLAVPAWASVEIQEVTSPGGIKAWLVEETSIPFAALEIRFRGGTSLDADGKRGATNLMMALLEEGAGDLDARDYAKAVEGLAARFSFDAHSDAVTISAQFLTENRDEAVELLRLALREPTFGEADVDRVRAQVLSVIRSDETDPNSIAARAFYSDAYGDHPYGTAAEGTIDSVTALTRADIQDAHARVFARDRLFVGATGDISADELGAILDTLFADLPESAAPLPPDAAYALKGGVRVVEFETPQSVAIFGHRGIDRQDDDFFPAYVLNHILGGSNFGSRLTTEVREKRGLTYGISTFLASRDLSNLYIGQVASQNDRVAEAIEVVRAVWADTAANGVSQEELDQAITYLTGAYPLRFDGNANIAGILVGMQMTGLTPDYITTRNDRVRAVTLQDIRRVAARLLKPEDLYFVVVGQPDGL